MTIDEFVNEGELVAKYEKKIGGQYLATSAIIKHPKGYSFISSIVREDKDFPVLQKAKNWAKGLGYTKVSDRKCRDKNISNKAKQEIFAEIGEFVETYNIQGYLDIVIDKNKVTVTSEIGYNMLDKLLNKLTNILNKYGKGATFDVGADGKAIAILRDSRLKLKDTLEILETDKYKVYLDGDWVEITTRNGESLYSGNTTARTAREAFEMAKKQHIVDKSIIDEENHTFELGGKRQVVFGTGNFVAMENGQVYDKGYLGSSKYNNGKGWSTDEYIKHLKSLGYKEVKDSCTTKDADYEQPKYRSGQKFEHDGKTYQIIGTKESTADYTTGRKGISYEIKDLSKGYNFTQPCWELEKYVASGNYKLRDTSYKVSYKNRTFIVDASSKKEAASKVANKLKDARQLYNIFYESGGSTSVTSQYMTENELERLKNKGVLTGYGAIFRIDLDENGKYTTVYNER